ncbi:glycosyltransferase family 2 protein [Limibacter armeniacum]|uniref:glycosyltransferase family 2 protein n=1 Tax=Limibacter armeniacum TaxID=466084 RepID=UPI002FE54AA1
MWLFSILYSIIGIYCLFYAVYNTINLLAGVLWLHNKRKAIGGADTSNLEWVVFLPAYKPNERLLEALKVIRRASFDGTLHIYVLFQDADQRIVKQAQAFGCIIEQKSFSHVQGNPYHEALRHMAGTLKKWVGEGLLNPSHIVLLDKDNLVDVGFFSKAALYTDDYEIVQGCRKPLSTSSAGAVYDAMAESLNDTMLRASKMLQRSCPEFSGSGIVFPVETFNYLVNHLDGRAPGMDKNLMIQLLLRNLPVKVAYVPEAMLYEEKTDDLEALKRQRVRWFGNQYFNAIYYGKKLFKKGGQKALDYLLALYRPPRSVHWLLALVGAALEVIFLWNASWVPFPFFTISFLTIALGVLAFVLEAPRRMNSFFRLIIFAPILAWNNLISAFKGVQKKSQGKFIHTRDA